MKISSVIIICMSFLTACGVFERTLRLSGIGKKSALFFLLTVFTLNLFDLFTWEEGKASAGVIAAAVLLFGYAFSQDGRNKRKWAVFPISIAAGTVGLGLMLISEGAYYFLAVFPVAVLVAFGLPFAMAFSGLVPIMSTVFCYLYSRINDGFGMLELGEACLCLQLAGVMSSIFADLIKMRIKKEKLKLSHVRTRR